MAIIETAYEYITSDNHAVISSNEKRIINHILKLKKERPDDVVIDFLPEDNNGVIVAKVPRSWIKKPSPPPKKREYTDEELKVLAERMRAQCIHRKLEARIDENESDE